MRLDQLCRRVILNHMDIGSPIPYGTFYIEKWVREMFRISVYKFNESVENLIVECIITGSSRCESIRKYIISKELRNAVRLFSLEMITTSHPSRENACCPIYKRDPCAMVGGSSPSIYMYIDVTLKRPIEWELTQIDLETPELLNCTCTLPPSDHNLFRPWFPRISR